MFLSVCCMHILACMSLASRRVAYCGAFSATISVVHEIKFLGLHRVFAGWFARFYVRRKVDYVKQICLRNTLRYGRGRPISGHSSASTRLNERLPSEWVGLGAPGPLGRHCRDRRNAICHFDEWFRDDVASARLCTNGVPEAYRAESFGHCYAVDLTATLPSVVVITENYQNLRKSYENLPKTKLPKTYRNTNLNLTLNLTPILTLSPKPRPLIV